MSWEHSGKMLGEQEQWDGVPISLDLRGIVEDFFKKIGVFGSQKFIQEQLEEPFFFKGRRSYFLDEDHRIVQRESDYKSMACSSLNYLWNNFEFEPLAFSHRENVNERWHSLKFPGHNTEKIVSCQVLERWSEGERDDEQQLTSRFPPIEHTVPMRREICTPSADRSSIIRRWGIRKKESLREPIDRAKLKPN